MRVRPRRAGRVGQLGFIMVFLFMATARAHATDFPDHCSNLLTPWKRAGGTLTLPRDQGQFTISSADEPWKIQIVFDALKKQGVLVDDKITVHFNGADSVILKASELDGKLVAKDHEPYQLFQRLICDPDTASETRNLLVSEWLLQPTITGDPLRFAFNTFFKLKSVASFSLQEQKTLLERYYASPDFTVALPTNRRFREQTYLSLITRRHSETDRVLQRLITGVLERLEEIRLHAKSTL